MMTLAAALLWRYGGVADTSDGAIVAWRHPTLAKPTDPEIAALLDDYRIHSLQQAVKAEASSRILRLAPEWKQRNRLARSAELLRKGEANLTVDEAAEVAQIDTFWQWAKMVRAFSDQLEAAVVAGTITKEDDIRQAAWPPLVAPLSAEG